MANSKTVAVIVAHPDDETLWAGGTILDHPEWDTTIISLCRKSDPDRAPKFFRALQFLQAKGAIGDMEDGPEQKPLKDNEVMETILALLPMTSFDLIITHDLHGEYTRHRRHEETSKAVITLWQKNKIKTKALWTFAYEDGNKTYLPQPIKTAPVFRLLSADTWQKKYELITTIYGFPKEGWEARTTPKAEAFWKFNDPAEVRDWSSKHSGL